MTGRTLRLVVVDPDRTALDHYQAALSPLGHVTRLVTSGPELVQACPLLEPDVLIVVQAVGLDGLAAAEQVCRSRPVPIVLVADTLEPRLADRALACEWVMACLAKPLGAEALGAAVALAVRRFEQLQHARAEAVDLARALEDRKVVERAKEVVARRCGTTAAEAYRRMRKAASNANLKMVDVGRKVLAAEAVFTDLEGIGE